MNTPTIKINEKSSLIQEIKSVLNQRRVVFFSKYPDARMQQLINDAEAKVSILRSASGDQFIQMLKTFNVRYIYPLIPSAKSPMHKSICNLYRKINNL